MQIGRKIIYDKSTGNVIQDCGERSGSVIETTLEQDFQSYTALQGILQSSVGVVQLAYGQYSDNFAKYPYHIDITKNPIDDTAIVWDTNNPIGASLADVQASKIAQMSDFYNQAITNTFISTAFDGTTMETYACDAVNQARMNGETTASMAVLQGYSNEIISWKNTSQAQCETWQPKNMINLFNDLHKFLTTQTDYMEALEVYIMSLKTTDAVNKVTWGMTLPTTTTAS